MKFFFSRGGEGIPGQRRAFHIKGVETKKEKDIKKEVLTISQEGKKGYPPPKIPRIRSLNIPIKEEGNASSP